ncbi:MAG TPA: hypothetical protein VHV30_12150 [Polyangiaceae bacterium]|jgi:hypothetical protein|nr:hypothetical protein [Polyangiaceae bacterium]
MAGDRDDEHRGEVVPAESPPVGHVRSAWRSWLSALATDAEAAMAAALAYESLTADARDAWLDALDADAPTLEVPQVALYAPLMAVESEPSRRARIESCIAADPHARPAAYGEAQALRGVAQDGTHACVIVAALYLDFVQVIACRYTPSGGFVTVRHDPMRHAGELTPVVEVDGIAVEPTPLRVVIEELAHAILADRRRQAATPPALASFAHLFGPDLDDAADAEGPPSDRF